MKDIFGILIVCIPSVMATVIAGILAIQEKGGWGWFLFIAICAAPSRIKIS